MKLVLIGGAGVRAVFFTKGLASRAQQIGITEFVLYDINGPKLEIIGKLCQWVAKECNPDLKVVVTLDLNKALNDADFIITTIRVGGDHTRVIDEEIAFKYGIIGQETTGPGGFSMALRTIPVLVEYCKLAQELAPNAWIFNFTNPSGLVTQALRGLGFDRVLGICDTPNTTKIRIAEMLGINPDDLYVEFVGLNHLSWITKVIYENENILEKLVNDPDFLQKIGEFKIFDPELIRAIKYLPNEYLYYYYHREEAVRNILRCGNTRGLMVEANNLEMLQALSQIDINRYPDRALQTYLHFMLKRESSYMSIETGNNSSPIVQNTQNLLQDKLTMPDSLGYAGVMLDFAAALQNGIEKNIVLSVPAGKNVAGFADSDVLEITCQVTKNGPIPVKVKELPEEIYLLMKNVKLYEKLTIEASLMKSRELAVKALMVHPLVNSYSLAKSLVTEYLEAYKDTLGVWR